MEWRKGREGCRLMDSEKAQLCCRWDGASRIGRLGGDPAGQVWHGHAWNAACVWATDRQITPTARRAVHLANPKNNSQSLRPCRGGVVSGDAGGGAGEVDMCWLCEVVWQPGMQPVYLEHTDASANATATV